MSRRPSYQKWLYRAFLLVGVATFLNSNKILTAQLPIVDNNGIRTIFIPLISTVADVQTQSGRPQTTNSQAENIHERHFADDLVGIPMEEIEAAIDLDKRVRNDLTAAAVSGSPNQIGVWGPVVNAPVVAIFAALLPNGNVLMWDSVGDDPTWTYPDQSYTRAAVWYPDSNTSTNVNVSGYNLFCAGFLQLSDGRLLTAGGNKNVALDGIRKTHIFDYQTNSWSLGQDMNEERWYPSLAALPNDEVFIMAGGPSTHEVYQTDGSFRQSVTLAHPEHYPFIQAIVGGKVLYSGPSPSMRIIDPSGAGSFISYGHINNDSTYRNYASYAMYDVGRVIVSGGAFPARQEALLIDASDGTPSSSVTGSMIYARRQHMLTILPDGRVLATGGLSSSANYVDPQNGVYAAEVWDPATGQWTEWASMQVSRQYHSITLLLPDGRIMTGGGGVCTECMNENYLEKNVEYFSPPYLFDALGQPADRPIISSVPDAVAFGHDFKIGSPDAASIDKVSLIRLGAPTHGQNMGQRFIPLTFTLSNNMVTATAPADGNIAPPGYYMLFLVDSNGVPSIAEFVRVDEEIEQVAPLNSINTSMPAFEWRPRPTATEYKIAIYDQTNMNVLFFNDSSPYAASAICTGNDPDTDICSVQPSVSLSSGVDYLWLVKAFVNGAPGPWSIYQ